MDNKIGDWIGHARDMARRLLDAAAQEGKIPDSIDTGRFPELGSPEYYMHRAKQMQHYDQKYDWESFVKSKRRQKARRRLRIAGYAASVAILLGAGVLLYSQLGRQDQTTQIADFDPGTARAILVTGDGEEIILTGHYKGTVAPDGTVITTPQEGQLAYQTEGLDATEERRHTLRTPRGGEYSLELPDGTRVWLNAESELTYIVGKHTQTREVTLKGEAYFEVAHDPQRPFYVNSSGIRVHATGTAFNVSAYEDDTDLLVTLVEGGVNIETEDQILASLTPDQQFGMNTDSGQYTIRSVNPEVANAWKNGFLYFDDEPLGSIIKKLQRWYDVQIGVSSPEINGYRFTGRTKKYESANNVLYMLELTREIRYEILDDNSILIKPYKE